MEVEDTPVHWNNKPSNKKSTKDGKRFTDEQVKLLESMFKEKTKLEPRKKLELARDLGLQPRQVAIWFQNRRARWKSKQIEHEYRVLKEEFDKLNIQFESLKKEKESLLKQVKELNDQLENNHSGSSRSQDSIESEIYTCSVNGGTELEWKDNIQDCLVATLDQERITEVDNDRTIEQFKWKEEAEFWDVEELGDSPLASPEHWCAIDQDGPLDLSCGNSKLWEF